MTESVPEAAGFTLQPNAALVVVDVQAGFDDPWWGPRNNPDADRNIASLVEAFARSGRPLVFVRHDSTNPESPLHPNRPGNQLKSYLTRTPQLEVRKTVNSCFHGIPDLDAWLRVQGISQLAIVGITTNHCCETTARVGGNLGYDVLFVLDATHTFDRTGPDGRSYAAGQIAAVTATNLHEEFATVTTTARLLDACEERSPVGHSNDGGVNDVAFSPSEPLLVTTDGEGITGYVVE